MLTKPNDTNPISVSVIKAFSTYTSKKHLINKCAIIYTGRNAGSRVFLLLLNYNKDVTNLTQTNLI